MEPPLFPIVFWCNAPEAGLIGAVSLFKFRRIKHLIVAAITELVVRGALPFNERTHAGFAPQAHWIIWVGCVVSTKTAPRLPPRSRRGTRLIVLMLGEPFTPGTIAVMQSRYGELAGIYQALAMPILQNFIDALPTASGHVSEFSLRDVKLHGGALQRV
jgi:hypothetical protein